MYEYLESGMLTMFFDAVLIFSMVGLWALWLKQLKQRKGIETMLTEASTQLQEATLMLNQALVHIQGIKSGDVDVGGQRDVVSISGDRGVNDMKKEKFKAELEERVQIQSRAEEQVSTAGVSQVAQMLRLQREGLKPEKIAEKLQMPLAQIKLMLMLQTSSNS